MLWNNKGLELDDLTEAIAHRLYKTLVKTLAPEGVYPWLKDLALKTGSDAFNREWITLNMFLFSEAFSETFEGNARGEELVKRVNNMMFEAFADAGLFEKNGVLGMVMMRYSQYFDGIKIKGSLPAGTTDTFLAILRDTSGARDLFLADYVVFAYSSSLQLSKDLERTL